MDLPPGRRVAGTGSAMTGQRPRVALVHPRGLEPITPACKPSRGAQTPGAIGLSRFVPVVPVTLSNRDGL